MNTTYRVRPPSPTSTLIHSAALITPSMNLLADLPDHVGIPFVTQDVEPSPLHIALPIAPTDNVPGPPPSCSVSYGWLVLVVIFWLF